MDKELKELMQISIVSENEFLSEMLVDIVPTENKEVMNSVLKIEGQNDIKADISNNQEFRIVVYKKENPLIRFFKGIRFAFKKIRIMENSKEIELAQNEKER